MPQFKDLSGKRIGSLVVIGQTPERTKTGAIQWDCLCDCGNKKTIAASNIGKNTNSCGCIRNTQGANTRKHPLWSKWNGMISRCTLECVASYADYGGRGIEVCERWRKFENFLEDMEPTFFVGATLERKDVNGNYDPSNVVWATTKEQGRNKRNSINIETPWGRMNVAEAAERIGMNRGRFKSRVRIGWTTEQLFDPDNYGALTKWDRRKGARNA